MTDDELIEAARRGDPAATRGLYTAHAAKVYAITRRILSDDALAEDAAQDTWIKVFRGLGGFRREARFSTWIHRVAVNCALQHLRKRKRTVAREVPIPLGLVGPATKRSGLLRVQLERALASLPDRMRTVLVLHDVEGFTHEEIGEMVGVAPGTSKSQLFKARAKMRHLLAPSMTSAAAGLPDRAGAVR